MAELYWIRTSTMTDMFQEGYIGITTHTTEKRWKAHVSASKQESKSHLPIYKAIRKYGAENLTVQVLVVGEDGYIFHLEARLRPTTKIGWNLAQGGDVPNKGWVPTQQYRDNVSKRFKGVKRPQEERVARSESMKGAFAWENRAADKARWSRCLEFFKHLTTHPDDSYLKLATSFGYSGHDLITIHKKLKAGWNPSEDAEWLAFKESYNKEASETTSAN